ncbi:protein of unknown function [Streptomyces sp. KY70]|nr:protein of unknown function [Streptomyces sp. KY70]
MMDACRRTGPDSAPPRRDDLDGLLGIEAGIAEAEVLVADPAELGGVQDALGDLLRGGLQVETGGDTAVRAHGVLEVLDLPHHRRHHAGLETVGAGDGVAVHRVRQPEHRVAGLVDRTDQGGQPLGHVVGAHPRDECEPAGVPPGVETVAQGEQRLRRHGRPDLDRDGVGDGGEQRDVGAVQLPGALADPRPVGRGQQQGAVGFAAQQRQFVVEQQCLMAGPDGDVEHRAARGAAPAEVVHDVAGGPVAGQQMPRIGAAQLRVGLRTVDHVAAVDRQFDAVHQLGRGRSGLAELAGQPPHPYDRVPRGELHRPGQEVQQRALARDVLGGGLGRVLGAVTGLDHLEMTRGGFREQGAQTAYRLGIHQGRHPFEVCLYVPETWMGAPVGLLQRGYGSDGGLNVNHRFPQQGVPERGPAAGGRGEA